MKKIFTLALFGLLLSDCGSTHIGRQYEFREPDVTIASDVGYLVVETDRIKAKDFSDDVEYDVFKGYSIYTPQGIYVIDVPKSNLSAVRVKLKAGDYIVVAEMHKNVIQSFTVKVEKGKMLEIDKSMIENLFPTLSERSATD